MTNPNGQDRSVRDPQHTPAELAAIEELVRKVSAEGARAETLVDAQPENIASLLARLAPTRKHEAKPFKIGIRRYGNAAKGSSSDGIDRSRPIQTEGSRILYDALFGPHDDDVRRQRS